MWKIIILIFLLLLRGEVDSTIAPTVSKKGKQEFFCNENQNIHIYTRTNVHPYIKLKINHTRLDAKVYRAGFYQTYLGNVLLFSNIDVEITFQGVENLKREDDEPAPPDAPKEIIVDYKWDGFTYEGDDLIDDEHPLNFAYTYLPAGEGAYKIEIDGQEVEGAYFLPLQVRARISKAHLINRWFSDPNGFIMTIVGVE